jgi:catechol 2,3-dioxygenase-like lactoylglutathione lyase family enzyme
MMPDRPTSSPAQIIQGAPLLSVPDVASAATFYRDVLGFRTDPEGTSDADTVVWRDNAAIHLARADRPPSGAGVFLWVEDVDAYHQEVVDRGAEVSVPLGNRPYGIRDFSVRDPDGITIVFGQDWYPDGPR